MFSLTETDIFGVFTNLRLLAFANKSICGKSMRIICASTGVNALARNFCYWIRSVGRNRFGAGVPCNLYAWCFTLL